MNYIEVDKDSVPYSFEIDLAGEEFELEVNYNNRFDYFTVDLHKDGEVIVVGEKLSLGRALFEGIVDINLPKVKIIPRDRSGIEVGITYDNLEATVFLYVE